MKDPENELFEEKLLKILLKIFENFDALAHRQAADDLLYFDNADLKRRFNLSDSTLHRMRKNKEIPFFKLSGRYYYPISHFRNLSKL